MTNSRMMLAQLTERLCKANRYELRDELIGMIEGRLTKFHVNSDMEPERCAYGNLCLGFHMDDPIAMSEMILKMQEAEARGDAVVSGKGLRSVEHMKYESEIRSEADMRALKDHWRAITELQTAAYCGLLRVAIIAIRTGDRVFRADIFVDLMGTDDWDTAIASAAELCENKFATYSSHDSYPAYTVSEIDILKALSYGEYLNELGILLDEAHEIVDGEAERARTLTHRFIARSRS